MVHVIFLYKNLNIQKKDSLVDHVSPLSKTIGYSIFLWVTFLVVSQKEKILVVFIDTTLVDSIID